MSSWWTKTDDHPRVGDLVYWEYVDHSAHLPARRYSGPTFKRAVKGERLKSQRSLTTSLVWLPIGWDLVHLLVDVGVTTVTWHNEMGLFTADRYDEVPYLLSSECVIMKRGA